MLPVPVPVAVHVLVHEGGGGGCGGGDSGWALLAVAEHESTPPHPFLISAWESLSVSAMFQGAGPRAHLLNSRQELDGVKLHMTGSAQHRQKMEDLVKSQARSS